MSKCQHQRYPKMSYKSLYSWNNAAGLQYLFIHLMQSKYNSMVSYWKWKAMDSNSYLGVSIDFQGVCVCEIWGITLPSGSRKKTRVWKILGGYLLANTFLWYFHHWHFALYSNSIFFREAHCNRAAHRGKRSPLFETLVAPLFLKLLANKF